MEDLVPHRIRTDKVGLRNSLLFQHIRGFQRLRRRQDESLRAEARDWRRELMTDPDSVRA